MEEAQRLLTVSVWKLYRCRLQRGGLRLHRSLQLSLLVRAARHRYLSARAAAAAAAEPGTSPEMATGHLTCAPAPNRGAPSVRPIPEPSDRPSGDPSNLSIPDPSNRPTGNISDRPVPDPSDRPIPDLSNLSIPDPSNRPTGNPSNQLVPDPCSVPDRGDPRDPHRADPPSPPAPYRGDQHIRNASDRGELPSPDLANRDHPRDHPQDSPNRDLPNAAAAPPPEPLKPLGPLPPARAGRKRRSSGSAADGPVPVPSKRARLEAEEPPLPPGAPPGRCLAPLPAAFSLLIRAVGAC